MTYQSPRDRIRWFSVVNRGTKTIPGFGICSTKLDDGDNFVTQEDVEGQVVWRVYPCGETTAAALQDPTMLWVNGPTPIPPGGFGKASQDWPLQVLHNGKEDALPNGYDCGPPWPELTDPKDAFAVWSGGNAFVCLGHDATLAGGKGSLHTIWIAPNTRRGRICNGVATFSGSYHKEPATLSFYVGAGEDALHPPLRGAAAQSDGFRVYDDCLLWLSFSATLTSSDATEGDPLGMRICVDGKESALYAYRSLEIDTDYPATTYRTNENVATSGLLQVKRNQVITLVVGTTDDYATTASAGVLSFHRVYLPHERNVSNGLPSGGA